MTRKSGNRFSLATNAERVCAESMPKRDQVLIRFNWIRTEEMESVHGISRPRRGAFRGAGPKLAPSGYLPVEYAPLRRKGLGRWSHPASPPTFFHFVERALPRLA